MCRSPDGMNPYPNDGDFEDVTVASVRDESPHGWRIQRSDGWQFFVPPESPVAPVVGMLARFYGKGIGYPVRGLFLNGVCVFYRSVTAEKEHREIETYGADAADWLHKWDSGKSCWSITMGGIGPSYEQAIQITVAEIVRHSLDKKYDAAAWSEGDAWKRDRALIEAALFANPIIDKLGLSGAQWGAALSLAARLYLDGPRAVLLNASVKDRLIQVSKHWPLASEKR